MTERHGFKEVKVWGVAFKQQKTEGGTPEEEREMKG